MKSAMLRVLDKKGRRAGARASAGDKRGRKGERGYNKVGADEEEASEHWQKNLSLDRPRAGSCREEGASGHLPAHRLRGRTEPWPAMATLRLATIRRSLTDGKARPRARLRVYSTCSRGMRRIRVWDDFLRGTHHTIPSGGVFEWRHADEARLAA